VLAGATGHLQGEIVAKYQPAKLAAQEGHLRKTPSGAADLYLFGIVDEANLKVHGVAVPGGLSMLLHNDFSAPVPALEEFDESVRPPVAIPFYAFHLMVGLGTFFIVLTLGSLFLLRHPVSSVGYCGVRSPGRSARTRPAGWPRRWDGSRSWSIRSSRRPRRAEDRRGHEERTADAARARSRRPGISAIILFGLIYLLLFAVWIYVLHSKVMHGPDEPTVMVLSCLRRRPRRQFRRLQDVMNRSPGYR
jgi:cytochrome d ubiquinol oxidase subunit I